jgi:endonuclease/exonuclease/phosphatase family metal-dependent hydrolase
MPRSVLSLGFVCSVVVSAGLSLVLGACAAQGAGEDVETAGHAATRNEPGSRLRIVAGNLSSGTEQSWDPGHGIRMLKGLAPDVAVLQEFNYGKNTDEDYRKFLAAAFDDSFSYTAEPDVQVPNAVVSRYPIIEKGNWKDPQVSNRSFVWARIDVPGDKDLWAISLHLLTTGSQKRQAEATALVNKIKTVVPEGDYLVIGGDLNTNSRSEQCLQTLGRVTRTTAPWPVDSRNNGHTSRSRSKPYDWLVADPDLDVLGVPVEIGDHRFANGLVFDSRDFPDLPSVVPTQRNDSAASNMQHMAVVRDFTLPN